MLGLADEGEQVHHDGLEALLRQASILAHAGQHVWQQVVDGACALCPNTCPGHDKVTAVQYVFICAVLNSSCCLGRCEVSQPELSCQFVNGRSDGGLGQTGAQHSAHMKHAGRNDALCMQLKSICVERHAASRCHNERPTADVLHRTAAPSGLLYVTDGLDHVHI